jgi:hypothetical protein
VTSARTGQAHAARAMPRTPVVPAGLGRFACLSDVQLSGDGTLVAAVVTTNNLDENHRDSVIIVAAADGNAARGECSAYQLPSAGSAERLPRWAPTGPVLATAAQDGYSRAAQMGRSGPSTSRTWNSGSPGICDRLGTCERRWPREPRWIPGSRYLTATAGGLLTRSSSACRAAEPSTGTNGHMSFSRSARLVLPRCT